MAEVTEVFNNGQQAQFNRDTSKIFLGGKTDKAAVYTNTTGAEVTLLAGTLMGRITGGDWLPVDSANADGSEDARGILLTAYTVPDGVTQNIRVVDGGEVAGEGLVLVNPADELTTVINGIEIRDALETNTHVKIIFNSTELTRYDNTWS